jgi:hypothetical protein
LAGKGHAEEKVCITSTTGMENYIFTLPDELIASLRLRTSGKAQEAEVPAEPGEATTSLGCSTCQIKSLGTVAEQRTHFKTDWHKYNVKHRSYVSEEQFDQLAADGLAIHFGRSG